MARQSKRHQRTDPVQISYLPVIPWKRLQECAMSIAQELERIPYKQWNISEYPKRYQTSFSGFGPLSVEIQIVEVNAEYLQALVIVDSHTWTMAAGLEQGKVVGTTAPSISVVIPVDPNDKSRRIGM